MPERSLPAVLNTLPGTRPYPDILGQSQKLTASPHGGCVPSSHCHLRFLLIFLIYSSKHFLYLKWSYPATLLWFLFTSITITLFANSGQISQSFLFWEILQSKGRNWNAVAAAHHSALWCQTHQKPEQELSVCISTYHPPFTWLWSVSPQICGILRQKTGALFTSSSSQL